MTHDASRTMVWPTLRYRDASAAIRFLVDGLGFGEVAEYPGSAEGTIDHAELRWPLGGGVMLGTDRSESTIRALAAGTGAVYVVTDQPDALFARAEAAGATVIQGLTDEEYGSRGFTIRDPQGVHWSFGTYAGADAEGSAGTFD